jgi:hypothetical protein
MMNHGRPHRRLSRRARIVMLLFVLPILAFSASTRSADRSRSPEPAAGLQKSGTAVETTNRQSGHVVTINYAVDDLVYPVRGDSGASEVDFVPLIDRIRQQAAPGTWGDPGQITPYPKNVSLVISHNQAGHDAVRTLLSELRQSAPGSAE